MSPSPALANRFFINSSYSVYYRQLKKVEWSNEASSDYELLCPVVGRVNFKSDGEIGELRSGDFLLLGPGTSAVVTGNSAEIVTLALPAQFVMDYAVRMRLVAAQSTVFFPARVVRDDEKLTRFGTTLKAELIAEDAGRDIVIAALVEQILVHLLRRYSSLRRSGELELSRVGLIDRRIRRAVELMHSRVDEDLSLKEISAASYLSPFHFSRLFKKLTGTSPLAYLTSQRMTRAKSLLAETDLPVTQIASRVGYSSTSHFTRAFRQATGLTPKAFRAALISRS